MGVTIKKKTKVNKTLDTTVPTKCDNPNQILANGLNTRGADILISNRTIANNTNCKFFIRKATSKTINTKTNPVSSICFELISF